MAGSGIRSAILADHAEMRELLAGVQMLAKRFEQAFEDEPGIGEELQQRGLALYERFGAHLDHEQALLEPALLKGGPKGERLARRLANEHHEQRELLRYLLKRLSSRPPTLLIAKELQHFTDFLRFEMSQEEEVLLSPEALGESGD